MGKKIKAGGIAALGGARYASIGALTLVSGSFALLTSPFVWLATRFRNGLPSKKYVVHGVGDKSDTKFSEGERFRNHHKSIKESSAYKAKNYIKKLAKLPSSVLRDRTKDQIFTFEKLKKKNSALSIS